MPAFFALVAVRPVSMAAAVDPRPPESRIEAEVRRARGLIEKRQFTQALATALALLADGLISNEQQETLLRPMSEALPWLLQE